MLITYCVCVCVCVCVWKSQLSRVLLFCDPMVCGPLGSSVHGIFQAKVLEWVASSFSRGIFRTQDWTQFSHIASRFFTVRDNREVIYCHVANGPVSLQPTATFILSGNLPGPESRWCYATFIGWGPAAAMWAWRWGPWCSRDMEDGFPRASNPLEGETNSGCLLWPWLQFTCHYAHLSVRSGHNVQPTFNGRPWRLGSRITRCLEGGVPHIPSAFGQKILRTTRVVALFCVWYSPRQGFQSGQRHRVLPAEAAAPLALSGGGRELPQSAQGFPLMNPPRHCLRPSFHIADSCGKMHYLWFDVPPWAQIQHVASLACYRFSALSPGQAGWPCLGWHVTLQPGKTWLLTY